MGPAQQCNSSPPVTNTSMKYHHTCTHSMTNTAAPPTFVPEEHKMSNPPLLYDVNSCRCAAYTPCQSSKHLQLPKKMYFCKHTSNSSVLSESMLISGISWWDIKMKNSSQHWQVVQQRCRITSAIFAPLEKKKHKATGNTVCFLFCFVFVYHSSLLFPLAWCHCTRQDLNSRAT